MVLLFLIAVSIFSIFSKKKELPKVIFYSLTFEQAFINSSPHELRMFLHQMLEKKMIPETNALFEIRSFRWSRIIEPMFVYDIETYIAMRVLRRSDLKHLIRRTVQKSNPNKLLSASENFKIWKKNIWDFEVWTMVKERKSDTIFALTTQSMIRKLPTVFGMAEKITEKRIMIWYSSNNIPIQLKKHKNKSINLNFEAAGQIDLNLVWNLKQKVFVESLGLGRGYVFGPIVFQETSHDYKEKDLDSFIITYFDIAPMSVNLGNIYTLDFAVSNLREVVGLRKLVTQISGQSVKIYIKPKRKYVTSIHSKEYIKILRKLEKDGVIEVLDSGTRLFGLIANSHLVFGVPFTSPVEIAKNLDKNSAYLAFGSGKWHLPTVENGISIISDRDALNDFVLNALILEK